MRLEQLPPLTRMLGGAALLAVLALCASMAGLGAHAGLLPAEAGLAQPLPDLPTATPPRLEPLSSDAALAQRPLFEPDRRPHPFLLEGAAGGTRGSPGFDYVLTSVLITPGLQMAIVKPIDGDVPVRMRLDESVDAIPGWRLVELAARSAVFEGPQGRQVLELRNYDGTGSTTPPAHPSLNRQPMGMANAPDASAAMDADAGGGEAATAAVPEESNR